MGDEAAVKAALSKVRDTAKMNYDDIVSTLGSARTNLRTVWEPLLHDAEQVEEKGRVAKALALQTLNELEAKQLLNENRTKEARAKKSQCVKTIDELMETTDHQEKIWKQAESNLALVEQHFDMDRTQRALGESNNPEPADLASFLEFSETSDVTSLGVDGCLGKIHDARNFGASIKGNNSVRLADLHLRLLCKCLPLTLPKELREALAEEEGVDSPTAREEAFIASILQNSTSKSVKKWKKRQLDMQERAIDHTDYDGSLINDHPDTPKERPTKRAKSVQKNVVVPADQLEQFNKWLALMNATNEAGTAPADDVDRTEQDVDQTEYVAETNEIETETTADSKAVAEADSDTN